MDNPLFWKYGLYFVPYAKRKADEGHRYKMMEQHNKGIFSPSVHENGPIDGMHIEGELHGIYKVYISRDMLTNLPI